MRAYLFLHILILALLFAFLGMYLAKRLSAAIFEKNKQEESSEVTHIGSDSNAKTVFAQISKNQRENKSANEILEDMHTQDEKYCILNSEAKQSKK